MKTVGIYAIIWIGLVLSSLAGVRPVFAGEVELEACRVKVPSSPRSNEVRNRLLGTVTQPGPFRQELLSQGFSPGDRVFFRAFKQASYSEKGQQGTLEVWLQPSGAREYRWFKTYPIAAWGGGLGPKLKEGDGQSPEGFYAIQAPLLNPESQFHLSMNFGYPNDYDQSFHRTGSFVMIHAGTQSGGCLVFSLPHDEELYVLAEASLMKCAGEVPVAVFPFPLTDENLKSSDESPWSSFWQNLAEGYRIFEEQRRPPRVAASQGRYFFQYPLETAEELF